MPIRQTVSAQPQSAALTNKVIRNTYALLSMTLVFSAVCALVSVSSAAAPIHPLLYIAVMIGLLFAIQWKRNSAVALPLTFAFTGFSGYALGPVINYYLSLSNGAEIVGTSLGLTGLIFMGLSFYALTTRKDFSFMRGFLFAGLLVLIGVSLIGLFVDISGLQLAMAGAAVLIFSGFILYDTSSMVHGGETNYIMATISLYLSILNLFTALLQLVGFFSSDD
ncbi:Bax inhibitor-1/YccA family protein [Balneatrix alpica]|uniref:Bax inhibitor-1/YccA family protein n=1 Tax=Balneatrix alpica TaxID=75684 RepID=A0ABV5Z6Q3_9GAMM|nr:Bax inhibitor-1/YccA family protein [Balneatrix alpica]